MKIIKAFLFSISIFLLASNVSLAVGTVDTTTPTTSNPLSTDTDTSTGTTSNSVSGSISVSSCGISSGASSCSGSVTIISSGTGSYSHNLYIDENKYISINNGDSPKNVSILINYGSHQVDLQGETPSSSTILSSKTISATCATGTTWNGSTCSTPGGTLTATSCSVAKGNTSCDASLTWTTTGATGAVSVLSSHPSANTVVSSASSGSNVTSSVPKGSTTTFSLKNSGVNVVSKTVTPAYGSFTSYSCEIADFESTCYPTFSYTSTNATNLAVTTLGDSSVSTSMSATSFEDANHPLDIVTGRDYYLYNNGVLMDSITISPVCASGNWGGSSCLPSESSFSGEGSLSASACDIVELGKSCLTTISWGITSVNDIGEKVRVYLNGNTLLKEINTSSDVKNGYFNATIPYGTNYFYLQGASGMIKKATGNAVCASGTVWDNTKCLGVYAWNEMVLDNFSVTRCSIPEGASTCNAILNWKINPFSGSDTATVKVSINGSVSTIFTGNSGTNISYTVGKNDGTRISLYYRDTELGSLLASPTYGQFNNVNIQCVIAPMHSTCDPYLSWTVSNSEYLPFITATINGTKTNITSGTSGLFDDKTHTLGYQQNRSYYIYHDSKQLDSVNVASACATGTSWNGSMCSPGYVSIATSCSDYITINGGDLCFPKTMGTTCEIPINGTSCNVYDSFIWSISVPKPEIYSENDTQFSIITRGSDGTVINPETITNIVGYSNISSPVLAWTLHKKYNMVGPRSIAFDAYYDTKLLDSKTATSYCAAGSLWNGAKCLPATLTASDCLISLGSNTCSSHIAWNIPSINTGYAKELVILKNGVQASSNSIASSGSSDNIISYGSSDLYIRYWEAANCEVGSPRDGGGVSCTPIVNPVKYGIPLTPIVANATCGKSNNIQLAWDGSKCVFPTGTISRGTCDIPVGGDHCSANITWKVTNPVDGANTAFNAYGNSPTNPQSTTLSGTKAITAYYNIVTNTNLYHNGVELAKSTVAAQCTQGTIWNWEGGGQKCISTTIPLDGDIWNSTCTIPVGGNSCQFDLSWNAWSKVPVDPSPTESYIQMVYDGEINGTTIHTNTLSEQYYEDNLGHVWTSDKYFDQVNISSDYNTPSTAKYTLPDMDVDYAPDSSGNGGNGIMHRTATFNLVGTYETKYNTYHPVLASIKVTASCAGGSEWVENTKTCMEICPATAVRNATTNACETKTITLKVLDANLAEVPTSVGLVKQTVNGVTSTSTRLRTAKALSPASTTNPVYLDWEASTNFNLDTLVCKLKDSSGNVLKTWEKVRQQSYAVNPNSTSTYSVTCNDGQ